MSIEMDENTDYVHTHVINYEPAYNALMAVVAETDEGEDAEDLATPLSEEMYPHCLAMGLKHSDLDDVDWQRMIEYEAENRE